MTRESSGGEQIVHPSAAELERKDAPAATCQDEDKAPEPAPQKPQSPTPVIELSHARFVVMVVLANAVFIGFMTCFLFGITLRSGIIDSIGSSAKADRYVEIFQTANGYFAAIVGELLESSFEVFIAVMVTYVTLLVPQLTGDRTGSGITRAKFVAYIVFGPAMFFVLNVGISAMNIKHTVTGVYRTFLQDDLSAVSLLLSTPNSTRTNIKDTILRPLVMNRVVAFDLLSNSSCRVNSSTSSETSSTSETVEMPTRKDVRSTATVFGFTPQAWNYRVLPDALVPTHSVNVTLGGWGTEDEEAVALFQQETGLTYLTAYEMFLQGKTLLERSVSDSNVSAEYPCTWVDGRSEGDMPLIPVSSSSSSSGFEFGDVEYEGFSYFDEGEYIGMRKCNGAVSSLPDLANMTDPATHSLEYFAAVAMNGFNMTLGQIAPEDITMKLESFQLSRQMNVTAMTFDIPFSEEAQYRDTSEYCYSNHSVREEYIDPSWDASDLGAMQLIYCDQWYYPYDAPRATCSSDSCVFLDKSGQVPLKKQVLLLPYHQNCSVSDMKYDNDYLNFLPSECVKRSDAVFVYGLGTFMEGFEFSSDDGFPSIFHPRRHIVLTFAKIEWVLEETNKVFAASCGTATGTCSGLVHPMTNRTHPSSTYIEALLVGNDSLPPDRMLADFKRPVPLVTLNSPPFYYKSANAFFQWEYLDKKRFDTVDWTPLTTCSVLIDSYLVQIEANHYYMDEPLQPMYASSFFYLFQNATIHDVVLAAGSSSLSAVLGSTRFKGDLERKEIRYSVPVASAVATYIGVGILVVLMTLVLTAPQAHVKASEEDNVAARYAEILTEEEYPDQVHVRQFALPGGDKVEMEEYKVDGIRFRYVHENRDMELRL